MTAQTVTQSQYLTGQLSGATVPAFVISQPNQNDVAVPVVGSGSAYGATAMTVGVSCPAGSRLLVNCTVAGNITVTMASGDSLTIGVVVGSVILPLQVTEVVSETATSTFYNLY